MESSGKANKLKYSEEFNVYRFIISQPNVDYVKSKPIDLIFKAGYLGFIVIQNKEEAKGDKVILRDSISIENKDQV
jgi:hypothetical protein